MAQVGMEVKVGGGWLMDLRFLFRAMGMFLSYMLLNCTL